MRRDAESHNGSPSPSKCSPSQEESISELLGSADRCGLTISTTRWANIGGLRIRISCSWSWWLRETKSGPRSRKFLRANGRATWLKIDIWLSWKRRTTKLSQLKPMSHRYLTLQSFKKYRKMWSWVLNYQPLSKSTHNKIQIKKNSTLSQISAYLFQSKLSRTANKAMQATSWSHKKICDSIYYKVWNRVGTCRSKTSMRWIWLTIVPFRWSSSSMTATCFRFWAALITNNSNWLSRKRLASPLKLRTDLFRFYILHSFNFTS